MAASGDEVLDLRWRKGRDFAHLEVDFRSLAYRLAFSCGDRAETSSFAFGAAGGTQSADARRRPQAVDIPTP